MTRREKEIKVTPTRAKAIVDMARRICDEAGKRLMVHISGSPVPIEAILERMKPGDMVMWDNRCVMHRRDAFDANSIRLMHRTAIEGERPV